MNNDKNSHHITPSGTTAHPEQTVPDNKPAKGVWPMFQRKGGIKFSSGEIVATTNAMNEISGDDIARGLSRHLSGDWARFARRIGSSMMKP